MEEIPFHLELGRAVLLTNNVDLSGADLSGADLRNAKGLKKEQLERAIGDKEDQGC